jgi:hypothetical protein
MISRLREYRSARALQGALERYERLVAEGADEGAARAKIADQVGADSAIFALATRLQASAAQMPEPSPRSVEAFARRLRAEPATDAPSPYRRALTQLALRRPRFQFAPAAAAAAVAVFAVLLIPGLNSLPGDALYGLKTASENTRVFVASGTSEARVRIGLAEERFEEVDDLLARAKNHQALGGVPGTYAAAAGDIDDPELAKLVGETLSRAGEQIVAAAQILIAEPTATATDLAALVAVSRQGQDVAESAAVQLPTVSPPARNTATTLARVEAQAEAVRKLGGPVTTPGPCPTATAVPTTTPTSSPTATPSLDSTPAPIPTASPMPTPCVTPTPTPTPTPAPTAAPEATPAPPVETQAPAAEGEPSDDGNSDDQASVESADQGPAAIPAG